MFVTAPPHFSKQHGSQHGRVGQGGAAQGGKENSRARGQQAQTPRETAQPPIHDVDRVVGDARVKHQLTHEDEQGDGREGEGRERGKDLEGHLLKPHGPHEDESPCKVDQEEAEGDRKSRGQHHEQPEDEETQDGPPFHDQPFLPSAVAPGAPLGNSEAGVCVSRSCVFPLVLRKEAARFRKN
jgi:hypothetical protein